MIVVFVPKGAITEVILVYDLKAIKYLHGDAKFSWEFCMGIPNFLGNLHGDSEFSSEFRMGCEIPWGIPKALKGLQTP